MFECINVNDSRPCNDETLDCIYYDSKKYDCRKKEIFGKVFGYLLPKYDNFMTSNHRPSIRNGIIITNDMDQAWSLLNDGKGGNGSKLRLLFSEEKNMKIAVSKLDLEFIRKIGFEYLKTHMNQINPKELRFFLRTCDKLSKIELKEFTLKWKERFGNECEDGILKFHYQDFREYDKSFDDYINKIGLSNNKKVHENIEK